MNTFDGTPLVKLLRRRRKNATFSREDYVRSLTCDKRCPCMCHDTNGSIHVHHGAACYGKLQWPATWQGSLSYWTVN